MRKTYLSKIFPLLLLLFVTGCNRSQESTPIIVSMQTVDRNGFAETVSTKDRLSIYDNVDFLNSQPYQKVMRVYKKDQEGKSHSKLTSYHANGGIWQYLEAVDNRAHGRFLEWHENGKPKIEATIIEGMADLNEMAQSSWLFDGQCTVWDELGNLKASFTYEKGNLEKEAKYYFPSGKIERVIQYAQGSAEGLDTTYDAEGNVLEQISYKANRKEGQCVASWEYGISKYQEQYRDGKLINGVYFDPKGQVVAEIQNGRGIKAEFDQALLHKLFQYQDGKPAGEVKVFTPSGKLQSTYTIHEAKKEGEEWQYYTDNDDASPKMMITWSEDRIQGMVKTWYKNGNLESQREITGNKKHGISLAYYNTGDLMLMEEYENDRIIKGSYFKKGEQEPVSTIENGDGTATLFTPTGQFHKKILYERSKPVVE